VVVTHFLTATDAGSVDSFSAFPQDAANERELFLHETLISSSRACARWCKEQCAGSDHKKQCAKIFIKRNCKRFSVSVRAHVQEDCL
jgi:hypothetical protein